MDSNELEELRRDYRELAAPAHVAGRVRASLLPTHVNRIQWLPITGTLTAALAIILLLPSLNDRRPTAPVTPSKPSMSALASLKPAAPAVAVPTLSGIRSVKKPLTPRKPTLSRIYF